MLRPFTSSDCHLLTQWVTSENELRIFSGDTWEYPINEQSIIDYLDSYPERHQFLYYDNEQAIGFGELILHKTDTPRLSRLIVSEPFRGLGHGAQMIHELVEASKEMLKLETIYLFVLEDNSVARNCYEKCGFNYVHDNTYNMSYKGASYPIFKMSKTLVK